MSRMLPTEIYARMGELAVIPVITMEDPESAIPLADALIEGGLPIAEITFRTNAASAALENIAAQRSGMLLGAGTILNADDLKRAAASGAAFAVAPGFNPKIVEEAIKISIPFSPG
jgi:2-dehydro-3-deoxyphosphogluconate aldolase / (4S)-4-hydroxy-2-oxoglutarate aldolase